ncbi:MAG TPA: hypothetical protein VGM10_22105 [Actinocrinis sp.]
MEGAAAILASFLLEDMMYRTVLPLGRRHGAPRALHGDLREQVHSVEREAGVRQQM